MRISLIEIVQTVRCFFPPSPLSQCTEAEEDEYLRTHMQSQGHLNDSHANEDLQEVTVCTVIAQTPCTDEAKTLLVKLNNGQEGKKHLHFHTQW